MAAAQVSVEVPGTTAGVRRAAEDLDAFALGQGLTREAIWPLQVALDEVLSNVVRHGFGGEGADRTVRLDFARREDQLEVLVEDDAPAFDPLQAPEPDTDAPLETRKIGGLGVVLARRLVDRIDYERREGKNRVRLRMSLAPRSGISEENER
jgi:anti-sigma regulatory factor (Ser/Thr protein kinase)